MEFYIFIITLTIFIVTLVITGALKKYVVSQDVNTLQSDTMQSTSNDMQYTTHTANNDAQQILEEDPMQNVKESFSYDNTMPLFVESKTPEDYIGNNRIYNPRPSISSI